MCDLKIYVCAQHDHKVHGVKIYRCAAAAPKGVQTVSDIIWANVPHLTQDKGCDGFRFPFEAEIVTSCDLKEDTSGPESPGEGEGWNVQRSP
ncbi:hypothetical protein DL770_006971 [Monosporascus sp. CRB-9-2]|nr:hypothetical protein DL770_006971 [Monosporascus sp. CRB-9-2]